MSAPDSEQLVYDEAVRALGRQRAAAAELRNGASVLIATAAVAVSLLGPGDRSDTPLGLLAVGAFVMVCLMALAVIWPHDGLSTAVDLRPLVSDLTETAAGSRRLSSSEMHRRLIMSMASHQTLNARRLTHVSRAFRTGALVLIVQLLLTVATRFVAA